jgi:hypothetical protein
VSKQPTISVIGILLIVAAASLTVLAGCASLRLQPAVGVSRGPGGVRPGDTNVTNLVAEGDVTVGGDLTVNGTCTGCGGGASYKVYVALLGGQDYATDPPVATVLENTLGGVVVWTVDDDAQYSGTLSGAFPPNKTVVFYPSYAAGEFWSPFDIGVSPDGNSIVVRGAAGGTLSNANSGAGRPIEIRVYP